MSGGISANRLPLTRDLTLAYVLSCAIALLMAGASLAGLIYQSAIYPTDELRRWFVINDGLNLAVGLPLLLGSLGLARGGQLIGLLSWPGALLYVLYVYFAYVIAVPFGPLFLPYLLLATASAYTLIGLLASVDGEAVRRRLSGRVPARAIATILLVFAILVFARQVGAIFAALASQVVVDAQEIAVWIDDVSVGCPALLVVGVQLWRRQALGYVGGAGLLLQYGVLALGLVPGLVTASPADGAGVVTVLLMAALCLVPFAFFARAATLGGEPVPGQESEAR